MEESEKTTTGTFEFDVKVKLFDKEKRELIEVLESHAKLTKADSGRSAAIQEDWITVKIDVNEKIGDLPKLEITSHSKLTKADAGRTE